ncbi:MAG: GIY-YIG nuclease family protein [Candidatus Curtissbacteria bacterium]|nr:GIY-YIG nuclease family protein [Candidatus Curtissbacteria bacterium]
MYYVYVLKLINGQYYTGFTKNIKNRPKRHFQGAVKTTSRIKPIGLVFYAAFKTQKLATDFEKYLKSSSGFAFRNKRLIETSL